MSQPHSLLQLEILEHLQTFFSEGSAPLENLLESASELLQDSSPQLALRLSELINTPAIEDEEFLEEILQELKKELPIE